MAVKAENVQVDIEIPEGYKPADRKLIGEAILEFIRLRTQEKGRDKNNRAFASYSKEYKESLDFKNAGKSSKVDLTLTGDMMATMDILKTAPDKIKIGFKTSDPEAGRAEGNILGTYGNKTPVQRPRDFLGITRTDLNTILSRFKKEDKQDKAFIGALVSYALAGLDKRTKK